MNKMCGINNQSGRSMIEMLGVLAIIGVLSVGGIAGYSKAMTKYRINKTIDQITQISQNVRMLYGKQRQKNYRNLSERILYKANLAPKEMFTVRGSIYQMLGAWGYIFQVSNVGEVFTLSTVVSDEEACIELATHDWGDSTTGLISISVIGYASSTERLSANCSGGTDYKFAYACPGGSVVPTPMPIDVAVDACKDPSTISWVFQ